MSFSRLAADAEDELGDVGARHPGATCPRPAGPGRCRRCSIPRRSRRPGSPAIRAGMGQNHTTKRIQTAGYNTLWRGNPAGRRPCPGRRRGRRSAFDWGAAGRCSPPGRCRSCGRRGSGRPVPPGCRGAPQTGQRNRLMTRPPCDVVDPLAAAQPQDTPRGILQMFSDWMPRHTTGTGASRHQGRQGGQRYRHAPTGASGR